MKVALCVIGRLENLYAREYVGYYKKLAMDKIFIYDNNHDGEEHFEDVLQDYIDEGFVQVIDYRNKTNLTDNGNIQLKAYNDCYERFGKDFDYMCFFDFDEFLTFTEDITVGEYVERSKGCDIILVNWMIFTDNNLVTYDDRPLLERFTTPMEFTKKVMYNFPEDCHIKSIVKCGLNGISFIQTPHAPIMPNRITACNGALEIVPRTLFVPYNFKLGYIKHFTTKTIEEYIDKLKRGVPDRTIETFKQTYNVDRFFKYNEKTKEKIDFLKNNNYI